MVRGNRGSVVKAPWNGCMIMFDIDSARPFMVTRREQLPEGWALASIDNSVASFRVRGVATPKDGRAVLAWLIFIGAVTSTRKAKP